MRLIALETATNACSAALWMDGEVRWLLESQAARRHGELILDQIDRLLAEAELRPGQLDGIAVGRGPGAFTGVRLGLGVAQGLAFAIERQVVPVSTLAALAQQGAERGARQVLAILDARMGELYWAEFETGPEGRVAVAEEFLSSPAGIVASWGGGASGCLSAPDSRSEPVAGVVAGAAQVRHAARLVLGSGLAAYPDLALRWGLDDSEMDPTAQPCAREVATLGAAALARGESVRPEMAQPVYLRDRVAEPRPFPVTNSGMAGGEL